MNKRTFVYSKLLNHTCFYDLKNGFVSLTYNSPENNVFCTFTPYDNFCNSRSSWISVRTAINRMIRNFSSFSFL